MAKRKQKLPAGRLFLSFSEIDLLNLVLKILRENFNKIDTLHISHIRVGISELYEEIKMYVDDVEHEYKINTTSWYNVLKASDRVPIDTDVFCQVCIKLLKGEAKDGYLFVYNMENKVIKSYKYR